ncbi:MAG: LPS export ABC transporter periplasmic protein LptC [Rhodospirillales bacterium]|nr:LPS export ABC transporter periplasmic protein LptC [Rhodospirillales bacterium]HJO96854.1 LPS export ABC transporter periplasmic protein LptC [Rhodospirillales bacterium]
MNTPTRTDKTSGGQHRGHRPGRTASTFIRRPGAPRRHAPGYSRFVAMMKFFLPLTALTLIVLIAVWPHLQPEDSRFRIGFAVLGAGETENPSMINARYVGTDEDDQPFSITADMATNLLKDATAVELEMPKADIALKDGTWLVLTAEAGSYDRAGKKLSLAGAVNLFHDSGYELRTPEAEIDLDKGIATGDKLVEGHGPFGELQAEGFRLENKGKLITFTGKASVLIYSEIGKSTQ